MLTEGKSMQSQATYNQLTFHYLDGRSESFNFFEPATADDGTQQSFQIEVRKLLQQDWWILHLPEQTVFINVANITKIEAKPTMPQIIGDGVFPDAERVTALNRVR